MLRMGGIVGSSDGWASALCYVLGVAREATWTKHMRQIWHIITTSHQANLCMCVCTCVSMCCAYTSICSLSLSLLMMMKMLRMISLSFDDDNVDDDDDNVDDDLSLF